MRFPGPPPTPPTPPQPPERPRVDPPAPPARTSVPVPLPEPGPPFAEGVVENITEWFELQVAPYAAEEPTLRKVERRLAANLDELDLAGADPLDALAEWAEEHLRDLAVTVEPAEPEEPWADDEHPPIERLLDTATAEALAKHQEGAFAKALRYGVHAAAYLVAPGLIVNDVVALLTDAVVPGPTALKEADRRKAADRKRIADFAQSQGFNLLKSFAV
ncbi:hypothetical protein BN159_2421 [Streptomyces davaonensis JCM 4913]|uniref:Uncharacterized protein n=1 Tax=Streptomyces davaonensis (strain DSM 101723 / JCM 4913 / KCC S-0913 / 768) TaxID=1214101 RepID=K4R135_STRDJ|nr:hypothetical protein [Streptomyces davaonensis]CCK26800.1 hypothetical protein BN159_2421 [Streptomyces davaonensis JCM 4913]